MNETTTLSQKKRLNQINLKKVKKNIKTFESIISWCLFPSLSVAAPDNTLKCLAYRTSGTVTNLQAHQTDITIQQPPNQEDFLAECVSAGMLLVLSSQSLPYLILS